MAKVVRVTSAQVLAAQMLIESAEERGEEVSNAIRKIAAAKRAPRQDQAPTALLPADLAQRVADGAIRLDDHEGWLRAQLKLVEELRAARAMSPDPVAPPMSSAS